MGSGLNSTVDKAGASDLFAENNCRVNTVFCLRGGDVTFYPDERQVQGGSSPEIVTVEVRFRGYNDDQARKGARGKRWRE